MPIDLLIHSAAQLVTCASDHPKRGAEMTDLGLIEGGAVAVDDGFIIDVGSSAELGSRYSPRRRIDASGKVVCPGFVDAHTHVVYVGDRAAEFEHADSRRDLSGDRGGRRRHPQHRSAGARRNGGAVGRRNAPTT